jgi:amino acid adenylation domain-containing protein
LNAIDNLRIAEPGPGPGPGPDPGPGTGNGNGHRHGQVPARKLHELLDDAAAATPRAPAIRDSTDGWTYFRLARLSHAFGNWLAKRGVSPGDRVLVQAPNCKELAAILFGCSRRGAVLVPINPGMKPYHLRSVLADCEPRIALVDYGAAAAIRQLTRTEVHELPEVWPDVENCPPGNATRAQTQAPAQAGSDASDIAVLIYTSGSTAAPKAVVCPHAQMSFAAAAINSMLRYRSTDVVFCRLPLAFDYGLYQILLSCLAGAEVALADGGSDVTLLRQIRQTGATVVPVVPSLASTLTTLAARDPGPTKVRLFTNTGAALPQATIDALHSRFPGAQVARMFGTTECKRISIMPPEAESERLASVGLPLPGTEVVILDDQGRRLPSGRTGEIVVSGPHVMAGYWRAPEITARTFRRDGRDSRHEQDGHDGHHGQVWLHTGDYGHLDDAGYLYFEGRRDDMFKHKGARMSTLEIEAAAMDIPGVRAAVVVPPADGGELEICVDSGLAPHQVLRELAARLEPAKVPAICHIVDAIPLTLNGKNDRGELAGLVRQKAGDA